MINATIHSNGSLLEKIRYIILFDGVEISLLQKILPAVQEIVVPAGQIILDYDSRGEHLYLILDGAIKISRTMKSGTEAILAVLLGGDFFGELELVDDRLRSAQVTALKESHLLKVHKKEFDLLLQHSPVFTHNFHRMLSLRLRSSNQTLIQQSDKYIETAQRQLQKLRQLIEASKILNSSLDIDHLLKLILETASRNVGADRGTVYLIDDIRHELWSKVLQGSALTEIRLPIGKGIAGFVASTGQTINITDAYSDPRFNPEVDRTTGYRTKTILCMPMKNKDGKIIGVFQLLNKNEGPFTKDDEEYLDALSVHASIAIENAQLAQQMIQSERLSAVGKMANNIIHDIKNPMGTLRVYAQVMKKKSENPETVKLADEMIHQIDRFVTMTQEILDFSRGVSTMVTEEIEFGKLITAALAFIEADLIKRNIRIVKNIGYDGVVKVDPDKIVRVLYNIASNAADAMPDGGALTLNVRAYSQTLTIEMIDTGCGMPPEIKAKVFEPFVTHKKKHGTGLGMSIVKKIVDDHNGKIEIESEVGHGTTVRIHLPLH